MLFFYAGLERQVGLTGNCIAAAAESEQSMLLRQVTQAAKALTMMSLYG